MEALAPFPRERTWLLPALREAQEALGHLPEAALAQVAAHLRVPLSEVWGVATGYPELRLAPRGHHHARVCTGVSCALLGGGELLAEAARRHGVAVGDTGADKALTLESADCFFECSMAPMIEVDGAYHGRVTPGDVAHLDRWFRAHAHHPAAPRGRAPARDRRGTRGHGAGRIGRRPLWTASSRRRTRGGAADPRCGSASRWERAAAP